MIDKMIRLTMPLACLMAFAISYAYASDGERTYILVNAQEHPPEYHALHFLNDYNFPVLLFGLQIGKGGQAKVKLAYSIGIKGRRRIVLIKDKGLLVIFQRKETREPFPPATAIVFKIPDADEKPWMKRVAVKDYINSMIAKNADGDEYFIVDRHQRAGHYEVEDISSVSRAFSLSSVDFQWENIVFTRKPRFSLEYRPYVWIVYDKELSCLCKEYGQERDPLHGAYPEELIRIMSGANSTSKFENEGSILRKDSGHWLVTSSFSDHGTRRHVFSYDYERKQWNSLEYSADMSLSSFGEWLCLSSFDREKARTSDTIDWTGDNVFYSLPDLKERFRWKSPTGWELLSMDKGLMLYRIDDGIWCADYGGNGVTNCRLLARAPYLRGVHWAMTRPDDSLGPSNSWLQPRIYPARLDLTPWEASRMPDAFKYFTTEPPPAPEVQMPSETDFKAAGPAMDASVPVPVPEPVPATPPARQPAPAD